MIKIAIASPSYPQSLEDGLHWVETLAQTAATAGARIVCFPESYLPGYPLPGRKNHTYTALQLEQALDSVCVIAEKNDIAIIIPMDWHHNGTLLNVAQVVSGSGKKLGYQTKNQLDPSEDTLWTAGTERHVFEIEGLRFGISICHEGFRYPETVRCAARQGASIVFHPNFTAGNALIKPLTRWGALENPYYEKGQMMRALENTIYFAPSNYVMPYQESASAVIAPDGTCVAHQEYDKPGVIVAEIDPDKATALLAKRFKAHVYNTI